jgi:WD40 repeat protein
MGEFTDKLAAKSPADQCAYLGGFPYNLVKSGNLEEYYQTLTNFDFLAAKLNHPDFGVQALIEDYDLVSDSEVLTHPEYNPEKVKALKLIQGALRLSAHVLAEDKTQLVGQLWGRMQGFDVPEIQGLLSQAKQSKTTGLRPLRASLTPPGGSLLRTLVGHSGSVYAVAVTPDGWQAISGSLDKTLKVWNLETGELRLSLEGHSDAVNAVAVTPDGKQAISGSSDRTLKVWNLETGELRLSLEGHSSFVTAVAVTPDGKQAISGSSDRTLKVWNLETGELCLSLEGHSDEVNAVAVTPDGKQAISGSEDKTLKLWNLETGELCLTLEGHSSLVYAVAVTPDGLQAISGSYDDTLKVWNLETGELRLSLEGHSDAVNAVAVTPDGKQAISGSDDDTLKVWNLETGEVIASFTGESPLFCCAVAPDGLTIVAGDSSGRVHFLRLEGMKEP